MSASYYPGCNIVDDDADVLVNTVNCVGVMGQGVAIPPPGCGNGGLDWRQVEPIVLRHLDDFDLRIYGEKTT